MSLILIDLHMFVIYISLGFELTFTFTFYLVKRVEMLLISIIEVHLNTIYLLFGFLGLHVEALMPVSFLIFCDLHALPEFKKAVPGPFKIFRLDFFYGFLHLCDVFLVSYISHLVQFIIMFLSKQFGFISLLLHSHINATSI